MPRSVITEQQIVAALHGVPTERWSEVLHFIDVLQLESASSDETAIQTAKDLRQSGLVGIWADQKDIGTVRLTRVS